MPLIFEIKVVPSSGKSACKLDKNGMLKCYLKSPPENGKANKELIKMLAKSIGAPQEDVEILSGEISRSKRIKINMNITFDQLLVKLGIERQMGMFEE